MPKVTILLSLLGFSICAFSDDTKYDDWKKNYERGECKAVVGNLSNVDTDTVLQCAPSPTVERLIVTGETLDYLGDTVNAQVTIENSNAYPVFVEFLTVDGLDELRNMIGYCSERVSLPIQAGDKITTQLSCSLQILPSADGVKLQPLTNIQRFKFVASPQF